MDLTILPGVRRLYQNDLTRLGYGSRYTIHRKRKRGLLPEPILDECERPFWTEEQLIEHNEMLRAQQEAIA